jgi:uncharacterized protein YdiU (UPF0061 family)
MAARMGLSAYDRTLSTELLKLMYEDSADFTNTYRALSTVTTGGGSGGNNSNNNNNSNGEVAGLPPALRAAIGSESFTPEREQAWLAWLRAYTAK